MTLRYYFELVQLSDYSRLIESKIKVLVYMSTKLASDDVYSKTLWGTMTMGGGGVRGVPEVWIRMQKRIENK